MYEVYKIVNDVNDKVYIGITSIGIKERWYEHVSSSRNLAKSGNQLYKDMKTYGVDHFHIILLESGISFEDRDEVERYYIAQYNSYAPNGYNLTLGGFDNLGVQWDASRGEKISKALKGKPKSESHRQALSKSRTGRFQKEDNPFYHKHHTAKTKQFLSKINSKPVNMYSKQGEFIQEFVSLKSASEFLVNNGYATSAVSTCLGRLSEVCNMYDDFNHTAYGFCWRFKKCND